MFIVLLALIIAFTITYFAIPVIITVAERKRLFDVPDERKVHQAPIPSLGGLGIFGGFIIAVLISAPFNTNFEIQFFLAAAVVIFFLGLKDDILIISPIKKFIGQVIASFLIIYGGDIQISNMQGFLGVFELPAWASLLLTYFTTMVIVNSFNLIDGIDGLAGSLGIIVCTFFGVYFYSIELHAYSVLAFAMAASVLAFLVYNFQPAKIFMGDTGSMLIGLVSAILVIKFISISQTTASGFPLAASPAIGFAALMIPLLDTLRVFAIRIFSRRSPFSPDRNHIHHLLLDRGFNHRSIAIGLSLINVTVLIAVYNLRSLGSTILIAAITTLFFAITALLAKRGRSKKVVPQPASLSIDMTDISATTIVPRSKTTMVGQEN